MLRQALPARPTGSMPRPPRLKSSRTLTRLGKCCHTWSWRLLPRPSLRQTRSRLHAQRRPARRTTATTTAQVCRCRSTRHINRVGLDEEEEERLGTVDAAATCRDMPPCCICVWCMPGQSYTFQADVAMVGVALQAAGVAEAAVVGPVPGAWVAVVGRSHPTVAVAAGATTAACGKRYQWQQLLMQRKLQGVAVTPTMASCHVT